MSPILHAARSGKRAAFLGLGAAPHYGGGPRAGVRPGEDRQDERSVGTLGEGAGLPLVKSIESESPRLRGGNYQVTSPRTRTYNRIAWTAGDTREWCWPDEPDDPPSAHWPVG